MSVSIATSRACSVFGMAGLLAWYARRLVTDPYKTKIATSCLVNPIGAMVAQVMQKGRVWNWKEIRYFFVWGIGLGELAQSTISRCGAIVPCMI